MIMTKEYKELLLKDLCARLPYEVKININGEEDTLLELGVDTGWVNASYDIDDVKPYLRSMSSMTEEEAKEYFSIQTGSIRGDMSAKIDFYIKHYFDFRLTSEGLSMIEAGLALEAPEGMYNIKEG